MAVARPLRLLGALSCVVFVYLLFQMTRTPKIVAPVSTGGSNGEKIDDFTRDPLLDRTLSPSEHLQA